jgi:hypothetical protein
MFLLFLGAAIKMDHFQPSSVDIRKQELLEARFLGARVTIKFISQFSLFGNPRKSVENSFWDTQNWFPPSKLIRIFKFPSNSSGTFANQINFHEHPTSILKNFPRASHGI